MRMIRVIVKLATRDGDVYEIEKAAGPGEYMVGSIEFRRDGLTSVNHGSPNGAHYLVTLRHPVNEKDRIYEVIPYDLMKKVMFIEVSKEESRGEESPETTTTMKRV
jgi:hypothetical protein